MIRDTDPHDAPPLRAECAEPAQSSGQKSGRDHSARCAHSARSGDDRSRAPSDRLTTTLLDIASEVEADERRLKLQIIEAARAGDCDRVTAITEKWLTNPPSEVLAHALITAAEIR